MAIWYILCSFGTFFPVLVPCTEKNLPTLDSKSKGELEVGQLGKAFKFSNLILFLSEDMRSEGKMQEASKRSSMTKMYYRNLSPDYRSPDKLSRDNMSPFKNT
jgi:hypothetical protein